MAHRTTMLWQLAVLAVLAVSTLASTEMEDLVRSSNRALQSECRTISDIVCETTVFHSFCDMLEDAGLAEIFQDGDLTWTVFVPTNSAFDEYDRISATNETDVDALTGVLLYHMIPDRLVNGAELQKCGQVLTMDTDEETTVVCGEEGEIFIAGSGNTADEEAPQIVVTDVIACNGIIHVLNGVLLADSSPEYAGEEPEQRPEDTEMPVETQEPTEEETEEPTEEDEDCKSIEEVVCEMAELSTMCTYLTEEDILDSEEQWTIFAPTDQGFDSIDYGIGNLEADQITDLVEYHTVRGEELFADDLSCQSELIMGNGMVSVTSCSPYSEFVYQEGPGNFGAMNYPKIIETDMTACNGVVHVVDQVMVPSVLMMPAVSRLGEKFQKDQLELQAKAEDGGRKRGRRRLITEKASKIIR